MTTHILGTNVTVCADDENETKIEHTILFDGWVIMNKHGLCLEYGQDFPQAVKDLSHITGVKNFTFLAHIGD